MVARSLALICPFALFLLFACDDEASTQTIYQDDRPVEKVNCAGGAKCAECCNDDACAVGQECNAGSTEDGRVILFCDGPEDCAAPGVCCVKQTDAGAVVAACGVCSGEGRRVCHLPANCGGANCVT